MEKATLDDLTGFLGVGAIEMFGAFLIADGNSNLIDWLNRLEAPQWLAVVAAIPLFVICYVIGLLSATIVQVGAMMVVSSSLDASVSARAAKSDLPMVTRRWENTERHSRLLHGCAFAFLVLTVGCLSEKHQLDPDLYFVGNACAVVGLMVGIVCIPLARRLERDFGMWLKLVETTPEAIA